MPCCGDVKSTRIKGKNRFLLYCIQRAQFFFFWRDNLSDLRVFFHYHSKLRAMQTVFFYLFVVSFCFSVRRSSVNVHGQQLTTYTKSLKKKRNLLRLADN